jgi:hypothetical protein
VDQPFQRAGSPPRDLSLGLYDIDCAPRAGVFGSAMPALAELRAGGHRFAPRLPRGLDAHQYALLEAPEGTWLLLTTGLE